MDKDEDPTNIIKRDEPATRVEGHVAAEPVGKNGGSATIKFFCPNGHSLSVSVKLAGKRGSCSRCGAPVQIPLTGGRADGPEEPPAPAETPPEVEEMPDFSGLQGEQPDNAPADDVPSMSEFEGLETAAKPEGESFERGQTFAAESEIGGMENPTAVLVAKLFGESEHGGVVELHLKSGQIVMPLLFDFQWSRGTHGLFASENKADNTITLMAVAWDAVEQVIVRKVRGLPDGMFEGP